MNKSKYIVPETRCVLRKNKTVLCSSWVGDGVGGGSYDTDHIVTQTDGYTVVEY